MDPFEIEVLGRVADDYEAIHTIRSDLERDLAHPVSANEVRAALVQLAAAGFVDPFTYDQIQHKYRRADLSAYSAEELWFFITPLGSAEYDRLVA